MKLNINKLYDTVEARVMELNGRRPNATEEFEAELGLDSLDGLDIIMTVEEEYNKDLPMGIMEDLPNDATLLDFVLLIYNNLNEI